MGPERIRNVGLFGHGGAGKTAVAEALLFNADQITRIGTVRSGAGVTLLRLDGSEPVSAWSGTNDTDRFSIMFTMRYALP